MRILVTSPYYRCGSTLVQRCLHQCEDLTMFGESNNVFTALATLYEELDSKIRFPKDKFESKMDNWKKKIDDDYSLCHDPENIRRGISSLCASYFRCDTPHVGIKTIGESKNSLFTAQSLEFKIIYVRRPWKESMKSYMNQDWSHLNAFNAAYNRSFGVNNKEYFDYLSKTSTYFRVLEYENISKEIFPIMDELGLKYDINKINSVLNNKINPGYK